MRQNRPYVNHKNAKRTLLFALEGHSPRLFTIKGDAGKGKSTLLNWYQEECQSRGIPVVLLNFKDLDRVDIFELLDAIQHQLPKCNFRNYQGRLSEYLKQSGRSITLQNVSLTASQVRDLTTGNPDLRRLWVIQLSTALFEDLARFSKNNRVIFLLDTLEKAGQEIKEWTREHVLIRCRDLGNFVVLVAGRDVFDLDSAYWETLHRFIRLPSSLTWDDWTEYAHEMGAFTEMGEKLLRRYFEFYEGDPQRMCLVCDPFGRLGDS